MNLTSFTFLLIFLPLSIIIYYLVPDKVKNIILLILSFIFYVLIDIKSLPIIIITIIINFIYPILVKKSSITENIILKRVFLTFIILFDVFLLVFYKFSIMPIGFSYITFNYIAYQVDVYNNPKKIEYNFINYALFIMFFGKILQGPIMRYKELEVQLLKNNANFTRLGSGLSLFIRGLAIKAIICVNLTHMLDFIDAGEYSYISLWIHEIFNLINLYLDFESYMLMAKGVGLAFGYELPDNFNFPLIASSITDFWRKWHMTLSFWFRDYVYIPLGGSKKGVVLNILALTSVWLLTGFWHGATFNFIIWGILNLIFIIIDKYICRKLIKKYNFIHYIITFFLMVLIFISFNYRNITDITVTYECIFMIKKLSITNLYLMAIFDKYIAFMVLGILVATPIPKILLDKLNDKSISISIIINFILIIISFAYLISESYSAFLYTKF